MTPEEAIRIIEVAKAECEWNAPLEYQEAFKVAIEALKAQSKHDQNTMSKQQDLETLSIKAEETCEDVISRQDAIDAVEFGITYAKVLNKETGEVMELFKKSNEELQKAVDRIEALPSAEPEQRWIPCSERLPENDERVLATTAWGEVTIAERIYPPINDTCWFIHDGNTNATIDDVVAWMPLQEPYKDVQ